MLAFNRSTATPSNSISSRRRWAWRFAMTIDATKSVSTSTWRTTRPATASVTSTTTFANLFTLRTFLTFVSLCLLVHFLASFRGPNAYRGITSFSHSAVIAGLITTANFCCWKLPCHSHWPNRHYRHSNRDTQSMHLVLANQTEIRR